MTVTINSFTYRSTVAVMGGHFMLPLSAENRRGAEVAAGDEVEVSVELDTAPREVAVPADPAAPHRRHDRQTRRRDSLTPYPEPTPSARPGTTAGTEAQATRPGRVLAVRNGGHDGYTGDMAEGFETDMLWDEFHRTVNMSSDELRSFLLTDASAEEGFPPDPDLGIDELGRGVLHVLSKRKGDLTTGDLAVMRQVVELVKTMGDMTDDDSRRELMIVGHDPLRG
ncbi:DUF3140 domain-containing protein [Nonomuraea sp. B12E4]|uniref:DUF3140 domain-containing protein n=1 Tax=Nonomuraea sp. B12E4 TaxID=3153564 RepID=UPI00325DC1A8